MPKAMTAFLAANPPTSTCGSSTTTGPRCSPCCDRRELDLIVAAAPGVADAVDLEVDDACRCVRAYFVVRPATRSPASSPPRWPTSSPSRWPAPPRAWGPELTETIRKARGEDRGSRGVPEFGCESFTMLKSVVRGTDHVLIATPSIVADELERGELRVVPLIEPFVATSFAVMKLRNRTLPPVAEHLIAAIADADRIVAQADRAREAGLLRSGTRAEPAREPARRHRARA